MGGHDQGVLQGGDTHGSIHDDGRMFHPIDVGARFFQGAGGGANDPAYNDPDPYLDPDLYKFTQVFRFFHDTLSPDSVLVNVRPFSVTKWESLYSSLFGSGTKPQFSRYPMWEATDPSFTPVIDESYRVVGHLGWITGDQICVPLFTVAADSPSALVLEKARLGEERDRILWNYDHPVQPFPFPVPRAKDSWEPQYISSLRKGPLKDGSDETRHRNNINYYLAGGGDALVGSEFARDLMMSRQYESFLMSDYRCLALVRPDGNLQGVLSVEKIPHQTREQKELKQLLEFVDLALTIWMIIDIATISVGLIRLGVLLAREAVIPAVRLAVDQGAKSALELLRLQARRSIPQALGRMAGPKAAADAFWAAGEVAPRQFTAAETKAWTARIADRMKKLGIPKENIGIRGIPGESGEAFTAAGTSRGANVRGRGISVHGNVEKDWAGFPEWNAASVDTRIDASIAHEWMEFNGLTHWETADLFAQSRLRISEEAKQLLLAMAKRGDTGRGFTEFTKAEWKAIVDAGKEKASFEEKKAVVEAAKAK